MSTAAKTVKSTDKKVISSTKFITITAILTAIAVVLQYLEFPVPMFIPPFVKFDFSDLPAILAAFLVSPVSGVLVCLLKNVIHIAVSQSAGVGELCNFLLGAVMVIPAWLIYKIKPSKGMAAAAMAIGSLITAIVSIFINYFITYPFYQEAYHLPIDAIIGMYRELNGGVGSLWDALIWFNAPFTFVKFLLDSIVVFFIYKPLAKAIK
jgi:riboflavin transporter FmnP